MSDDIIARLRCSYADPPCESCTFCAARAEIERLRAAGDALDEAMHEVSCSGSEEDITRLMDAHYAWQEARRG